MQVPEVLIDLVEEVAAEVQGEQIAARTKSKGASCVKAATSAER